MSHVSNVALALLPTAEMGSHIVSAAVSKEDLGPVFSEGFGMEVRNGLIFNDSDNEKPSTQYGGVSYHHVLRSGFIEELEQYCGRIDPLPLGQYMACFSGSKMEELE